MEGQLLAYGPLRDTGQGFYVYQTSAIEDAMAIVESDPGIRDGILALVETGTWSLGFEQLAAEGEALTLVDYVPGDAYPAGQTLHEIDLDDHLTWAQQQFDQGVILAGGPTGEQSGRYVYATSNVEDVLASDPAISEKVFTPEAHPWDVIQRQSPQSR